MCATAPTPAAFVVILLWNNVPRLLSLASQTNARSKVARL